MIDLIILVVFLGRWEGYVYAPPVNAVGGNVKFTILAAYDHNTWDATYSAPAFYNWLLQHQK